MALIFLDSSTGQPIVLDDVTYYNGILVESNATSGANRLYNVFITTADKLAPFTQFAYDVYVLYGYEYNWKYIFKNPTGSGENIQGNWAGQYTLPIGETLEEQTEDISISMTYSSGTSGQNFNYFPLIPGESDISTYIYYNTYIIYGMSGFPDIEVHPLPGGGTGGDGSISTVATVTLTNETFTVSNAAMTLNTHYSVANVPAGLTVVVTGTGTTTATIELTGNATAHEASDSITNMRITFLNPAFTDGVASSVTGSSKNNLSITFR